MTGSDRHPERRPNGAAFAIAALLAGFGGLLLWQGWVLPEAGGYAGVGSGGVPLFVGAGLILLALAHLAQAFGAAGGTRVAPQAILPVLLIVAGLLTQLVLLKPLGFSIASGLLFALTAAAFGKRNPAVTLPVGFLFALAVYGVFDQLLKLNLPAGFPETLIFGG